VLTPPVVVAGRTVFHKTDHLRLKLAKDMTRKDEKGRADDRCVSSFCPISGRVSRF